ncbi:MAG: phosphatase PAP2 family protein [Dehalococcoidia bacterium]|nr:MAG: phosphatase PAP2 family protein [Dehalococcoidia bacterium]
MSLRSLLELDARLSGQMRVAEQPGLLRNMLAFLAHSGDSWLWCGGLIILWFFGDPFWKKLAVVLLGGIAVLAIILITLKFLIRRRRPEGEWGRIYRNTDPHSFPSGHAARSFFITIAVTGFGPGWLAAILWVWAPLVVLARVALGVHYVSDIAVGALLGILLGLIGLPVCELLLAHAVS